MGNKDFPPREHLLVLNQTVFDDRQLCGKVVYAE
jgi:hypothetical protein